MPDLAWCRPAARPGRVRERPDRPQQGVESMQRLLTFSRVVDWLNAQIGKYVIWLIFAATAISALNAVVRKLFDTSSNAYLEAQWYLFAWSFLAAAGFTLLHRQHVRIDVVNSQLPKKLRVWIDIVGYTLFLTPMCLMVLYLCIPVAIEKLTSGEMSGNPGGLLRWPVWFALPVGFTLLLLQGWSELIKCIAFLRGAGPDPTEKRDAKSDEETLIDALREHASDDAGGSRATARAH